MIFKTLIGKLDLRRHNAKTHTPKQVRTPVLIPGTKIVYKKDYPSGLARLLANLKDK